MDFFTYKNGRLHAEDIAVSDIAAKVGTPFYLYSEAALTQQFRRLTDALSPLPHQVFFAVKALSNIAILRLLGDLGAGMDVVSAGEYQRARAAGVPGNRIVFSGVGKTRQEMRMALEGGVRQFNLESEPEMLALSEVASSMGATANVAVRVNPDVDAKTHHKIATGRKDNKFGIPIERARPLYAKIATLPGLNAIGIDVHIGSQLTALEPFETAFSMVAALALSLRSDGHAIERLDLGGGLGIAYDDLAPAPPQIEDYGALIKRTVGHLDLEIDIEPGRLIAGNAGLLLASVLFSKTGADRDFLVLDAAMNDLLRPALYDAHHDLLLVDLSGQSRKQKVYDVVGPVCETGDTFARSRILPEAREGDLVAFRSAGAYGAVMASQYNSRPLVPEVLVESGRFRIIRKRPSLEEMLALEVSTESAYF